MNIFPLIGSVSNTGYLVTQFHGNLSAIGVPTNHTANPFS